MNLNVAFLPSRLFSLIVVATLVTGSWLGSSALAQKSLGSLNSNSLSLASPTGGLQMPANPQGGGSPLADFQQLTQLIQTIVPSNWDIDGGEDTIQQSPSGVWIDTEGKLHRRERSKAALPVPVPDATAPALLELPLGDLQSTEGLRWISLSEVEAKLQQATDRKEYASTTMQLLGGLTRIDFVAYDKAKKSWFLGGPAGDLVLDRKGQLIGRDTGLPPILLEDLLTIAPMVLNAKGAMGCSIDPLPEKLKAVSELTVSPIAKRALTQQAAKWSAKLAETLGDQKATVFGLPEDSPTAVALLIADEHMKRIGLGLDGGPGTLMSYWEESEKRGSVPSSALIRWWFALRDDIQIGTDANNLVFSLSTPTVQVLSQDQWMDATGQRFDSAKRDLAADAFAKGFTDHFEKLQQMYPTIYGRMRHICDLSVALRIIREESMSQNFAAFKLLSDKSVQPHCAVPVKWIPSISAWRQTSGGRVAAIVSGGVSIDAKKTELHRTGNSNSPNVAKPFSLD